MPDLIFNKNELEQTRNAIKKILDENFYPYIEDYIFSSDYLGDYWTKLCTKMKEKTPLINIIEMIHQSKLKSYHREHPELPVIDFKTGWE